MENVESWMLRCPSGRAPRQDGVPMAESGSVGVKHVFGSNSIFINKQNACLTQTCLPKRSAKRYLSETWCNSQHHDYESVLQEGQTKKGGD